LTSPNGIALDLARRTMYWTDAGKIQRADYSGSHRQDLVTGLNSPFGISLDPAQSVPTLYLRGGRTLALCVALAGTAVIRRRRRAHPAL
jgi:hypothetical protein